MQRPQHMLPQLPLFQQCSIQSQDVMQTWLILDTTTCSTFSERFSGSLSPKPNECLHFDLESCNLMCTHTVVTDPCHIPPLAQARPMMLCIYTSWGEPERAPHLWIKRKFVYVYVWYVRIPYMLSALLCVMQYFHMLYMYNSCI